MTIIPGLLGMNVGGIPLRENEAGFWLVAMLTLLVVAPGAWLTFGRHRDS
jgi:zinc transporter